MKALMILISIPLVCLEGQVATSKQTVADRMVELWNGRLLERLKWEILWGGSPGRVRTPSNSSASVLVYLSSRFVYCSADLGVCAEYSLRGRALHQRDRILPLPRDRDEQEFLGEFVQASGLPWVGVGATKAKPMSFFFWSAVLKIPAKADIAREYRVLDKAAVRSVESWLQGKMARSQEYVEITIPCFKRTDPAVYVYGDRGTQTPVALMIGWNEEVEEWEDLNVLYRSEDTKRIAELRETIMSLRCGTVRFR